MWSVGLDGSLPKMPGLLANGETVALAPLDIVFVVLPGLQPVACKVPLE